MWTKIAVSALSSTVLLGAQAVRADHRDNRMWEAGRGSSYGDNYGRGYDYDYAKVLSTEPITRRIRVTQPRRECYEETRYDEPRDDRGYYDRGRDGRYRDSGRVPAAGSMILGGIIGAAIGNQFGRGDGRRAATVAGAVIGSAVGHDAAGRQADRDQRYDRDQGAYREGYSDGRPTTVRHCDVRYDESWEERIEAYMVTYEYNGRRYTTRMPYDPGPQLRVNVSVRPDGR